MEEREHVEEYVRSQCRSGCSPNGIRNSQLTLESLAAYLEGTGKKIWSTLRGEISKGLWSWNRPGDESLYSEKPLSIVKDFPRFMEEKGPIGEEVFRSAGDELERVEGCY